MGAGPVGPVPAPPFFSMLLKAIYEREEGKGKDRERERVRVKFVRDGWAFVLLPSDRREFWVRVGKLGCCLCGEKFSHPKGWFPLSDGRMICSRCAREKFGRNV